MKPITQMGRDELIARVRELEAERDRWVRRMKLLEARIGAACDVLRIAQFDDREKVGDDGNA